MTILGTVLGILIIVVTVVDVFLTILGGHTNGPVTERWTAFAWRGLLALHERRPVHGLLSIAGPALVLLTVVVWYSGLVLGAGLVLVSNPGAVVQSTTGALAGGLDIFYFTPVTISGLGYGDLVPSGFPWTTFATMVSLLGAVVLTFSLSYVISVTSAAITRRAFAMSVFGLGEGPAQIVSRLDLDDPRISMHGHLASLATTLNEVAEQQVTFPVLRYFHARRYQASPANATLVLADAVYLLAHQPPAHRSGEGLAQLLDGAIANFSHAKHVRSSEDGEAADHHDAVRQEAVVLDLDTAPGSDVMLGLETYEHRRKYLVAACRDDGWKPEARS